MPRDVIFSTDVEDLPTGVPLVVYLPTRTRVDDVTRLDLHRGRVTNVVTASDDGPPVENKVTLAGGGLGLAGRDRRGQRGLGVHWTRGGGFVQLAPCAVAHRVVITADDDEDPSHDVPVPSHWVTLDWAGCNRLIRFLRAARDQAFGRPE